MALKVGFNTLPLESGHKSRGMGFYVRNLLNSLKKNKEIEIVEFINSDELKEVDLVHYPFFDLFFKTLPLKKRFPTVVTIPDIAPLLFPNRYPPGLKGWLRNKIQLHSLKSAKAIITLSSSSRDDISRVLKIKGGIIFPIHLSYNPSFRVIKNKKLLEKVKSKYELPEKFALFIGNPNWNKNILGVAEACIRANIDIFFVGQAFENTLKTPHAELKSYNKFLETYHNHPLVHLLGFVDEKELVAICNLAYTLLLPSFYEGFGMPILEAQACGTPVITSNISSMPEVAGEGAILADPYNVDEIVEALTRINRNEELTNQLTKAGFENIKRFSWEKTAIETIDVYKKKAHH